MKRRILMIGGGVLLLLMTAGVAIPGKVKEAGEKATKIATSDRHDAGERAAETVPTARGEVVEQKTAPPLYDVADSPPSVEPSQPPAATTSTSATYQIDWQSINGGGGDIQSTNYDIQSSIGQSATGYATSTNYEIGAGYWYGVGGGGDCQCDCHGDPANCDGVQDITDVVQTINVAFRGAAAILDPNENCPYETTDTNCSTATDVIDVVKMVNVAFRGANVATEFCNPCP